MKPDCSVKEEALKKPNIFKPASKPLTLSRAGVFYLFGIALLLSLSMSCASFGTQGRSISLDDAIRYAVETLETDMDIRRQTPGLPPTGERPVIAVVNFTSHNYALSAYVVDELAMLLARGGRFDVAERTRLDTIRVEQDFQLSGEISEESMIFVGRFLGARYVATGSLTQIGNNYRFRVVSFNVETAVMTAPSAVDVPVNDPRIRAITEEARARARAEEREAAARVRTEEREAAARARTAARQDMVNEAYRANCKLALGGYFKWGDGIAGGGWTPFAARFSPVPFTVLGMEMRHGGFKHAQGDYPKENVSIALELGFVFPLLREDALQLFASGLFLVGYFGGMTGIIGNNVTVGFDAGISLFRWLELKYRGYFYQNNYLHSIGLNMVWHMRRWHFSRWR